MGDPEYIPEGQDPVARSDAGAELAGLVQDLGAYRREHPTDDLTSALVNATVDGEPLDQAELASFFILLVVAGNETTRNAMSHALQLLTEHPDQRAMWAADFDAAGDGGRRGDRALGVAGHLDAADGHERRHSRAGRSRRATSCCSSTTRPTATRRCSTTRSPSTSAARPTSTSGSAAPGPHFCLGAHLARREITVMFRELLRRVPDIRANGEPDRLRSSFINGIKHLPCTFTR